MKLVAIIQTMAKAGCTPDQIAAVTAAYEAEKAPRTEAKRKAARERQRLYRARNALSRDVTVTPPPLSPLSLDKEIPPAPPKENSTLSSLSSPPLGLSNDRPVDEPVDGPVSLKKTKRDVESLRVFGEAWNSLAGSLRLPAIDEIKSGSTRERHALARLRDMPAPDGIGQLMARIRGSPYLRGEINGFVCSFDWVIKPSNYQKIIEGNYENRKVTALRR